MEPHSPYNPQSPTPQQPAPPAHQYNPGALSEQPVAFDQFGNPLYAHPPQQPQFVHLSRAIQPIQEQIPPEIMQLHTESRRDFPQLNLSNGEFVISSIKRHPIGLFKIWGIAALLITAFMALLLGFFMNDSTTTTLSSFGDTNSFIMLGAVVLIILTVLVVIGAFVATYVYNSNRFYLTNESVIQEIQTGIFAKREQTVSLSNVEDASYKQGGLIQTFLNYGTIRLSTEGDETTYRFTYVSNPKKHIAILNNAVEAFKNGRPVELPTADQPS